MGKHMERLAVERVGALCEEFEFILEKSTYYHHKDVIEEGSGCQTVTHHCGCVVGLISLAHLGDIEVFAGLDRTGQEMIRTSAGHYTPYFQGLEAAFEESDLPCLFSSGIRIDNRRQVYDHDPIGRYDFDLGVEDGKKIAEACKYGELPYNFPPGHGPVPRPVEEAACSV